eukprot:1901026-Rhodomonas_salina.2
MVIVTVRNGPLPKSLLDPDTAIRPLSLESMLKGTSPGDRGDGIVRKASLKIQHADCLEFAKDSTLAPAQNHLQNAISSSGQFMVVRQSPTSLLLVVIACNPKNASGTGRDSGAASTAELSLGRRLSLDVEW